MFTVGEDLTVVLHRPEPRPWRDHWYVIRDAYSECDEAIGPKAASLGLPVIRSRFSRFFVEMDHLRDWLMTDDDELPDITEKVVNDYALNHEMLKIVNAFSNSIKHRKRRSGMVADITEIMFDPMRTTVKVTYSQGDGTFGVIDAMALARRAVEAWGTFFDEHDVSSPS